MEGTFLITGEKTNGKALGQKAVFWCVIAVLTLDSPMDMGLIGAAQKVLLLLVTLALMAEVVMYINGKRKK
ncbi:hypothetical protein [Streptomyces lavendofoliae]|uniref:Uncharacterized protein n=1 Tax=Streptomyces lavendofoliae TaxID=67314 RepID=A0A918I3E1_9ACTN|nr:hypothetical protein [Streptomyces lavendofoliae]GGU66130.1 hypothetical protein GCM10010274_63350 [Streptomyces lavendofoliae]